MNFSFFRLLKTKQKKYNMNWKDKRLWVGVLIVLIIMIVFYFSNSDILYCIVLEENIKQDIENAKFCEKNEDCVFANLGCLFGCKIIYVNKNMTTKIVKKVNSYIEKCSPPECQCASTPLQPICVDKRCEGDREKPRYRVTIDYVDCLNGEIRVINSGWLDLNTSRIYLYINNVQVKSPGWSKESISPGQTTTAKKDGDSHLNFTESLIRVGTSGNIKSYSCR
jgi:hypothetical protein